MCSFFFQAEDGIRDLVRSRGLGDVYKRQDQLDGIRGYSTGQTSHSPPHLFAVIAVPFDVPKSPLHGVRGALRLLRRNAVGSRQLLQPLRVGPQKPTRHRAALTLMLLSLIHI